MKKPLLHHPVHVYMALFSAIFLGILAGCESTKPIEKPVSMQVPSTVMYQQRWHAGNALASDILPMSDAAGFHAPRFYPVAYGPIELGGASAYRVYTYDSQAISTLGNSGWRTRYVVQTGITSP